MAVVATLIKKEMYITLNGHFTFHFCNLFYVLVLTLRYATIVRRTAEPLCKDSSIDNKDIYCKERNSLIKNTHQVRNFSV